jgi:hypothetical protein
MLSLQVETVKQLLQRIESGEASASEFNVARQLLKDNEIAIDIEKDEGLSDLHDTLPIFEGGDNHWSKH